MKYPHVVALLEGRIGLDVESIGLKTVESSIAHRMKENQCPDASSYLKVLENSQEEWHNLLEEITIPETWFFRDGESFAYLAGYAFRWLVRHPKRILRVLSVACCTGEEPYTIAMTLLDAGLPKNRFHIDAVDVNPAWLDIARAGLYRNRSFRGEADEIAAFRDRYFQPAESQSYRIDDSLAELVHFRLGNVVAPNLMQPCQTYDIVFCRNLFIYFSREAREQAMRNIEALLAEDGLMFMGGGETLTPEGFARVPSPHVFAYRRISAEEPTPILSLSASIARSLPTVTTTPAQPPVSETDPSNHAAESTTVVVTPPEISKLPPATHHDLLAEAQSRADAGHLAEAETLCQQHLDSHEADATGHFLMGIIQQAQGKNDWARSSFEKCIYLNNTHRQALLHLALLAQKRGDHYIAKTYKQRILRLGKP